MERIHAHVFSEVLSMKTRLTMALVLALSTIAGVWGQGLPPLYRIDTVAGTLPGEEGVAVSQAYLTRPTCALSDGDGGVLIVEQEAHRIRRVARDGKISSFAGTGAFGFSGDGGPATLAQLNYPTFAVRDTEGNVYVSDTNNHRVRRIAADGTISTIAGDGAAAHAGDAKPAVAASINLPQGIAVDSGKLYVAEIGGAFLQDSYIRVVDLDTGIISTLAGGQGRNGADGIDSKAAWVSTPRQLAIGPGGALVYTDITLYKVRAIMPDGKIKTLAGSTGRGGLANTGEGDGGSATAARLYSPFGVAVDGNGMVYVSDNVGQRVRRFPFSGGNITTVAGTGTGGFAGDGSAGSAARFHAPQGLNVADNGSLLIADRDNNRVRVLSTSGGVSTFAGRSQYAGDNVAAVGATLYQPRSIALDANQNILFTDRGNEVVRSIDTLGKIHLHSGKPNQFTTGSPTTEIVGPVGQIVWNNPTGVAFRSDGTTYVVDDLNARSIDTKNTVAIFGLSGSKIRVTDIAVNRANTFTTLADPDGNGLWRVNLSTKNSEGLGSSGAFAGDGGPLRSARMLTPEAVGYDDSGNLWIADSGHHRVRMANSSDTINTVVGTGRAENTGDFGPASAASIYYPMGIAFGRQGIGYVSTAHCIRALFTNGTIATVAGTCNAGGFAGDAGAAITGRLNAPQGMVVDSTGRVFFADSGNHRIRVLTPIPALRLEMVSGDKQSRLATAPLDRPLVVRLLAQGTILYPYAPVSFSVSQGSATLSADSVSTGVDGVASITATLGPNAGPITVTASAPGLAPVTFSLTARPIPAIASVTGGAGTNPTAAPGSLMAIAGSNIDPATACFYINDAKVTPIELTSTRIVAQVPATDAASINVAVSGDCGTTGEVRSVSVPLALAVTAPEFYYWKGNSVQAVIADTDNAIGPAGLIAGRVFRAALPGDIVAITATGFGPTDPPLDPGAVASGPGALLLPVVVTIGDFTFDPADVVYAGPATGKLGLYELRIRIPAGLPVGDLPVKIKVGDATSPDGATLTIGAGQ